MAHVMAIRSQSRSIFSARLFSNKPLIFSVLLTLVLQIAITYTPFLQAVFKTEALTWVEFVAVGLISSIIFIAVEIEKFFSIRKGKIAKVDIRLV